MTVENGQRVLSFPSRPGKDSPKAIYIMVTPLERDSSD